MEQVILVDEQDQELGSMEKMAAHQQAHLHRAFSIFIFNEKKELLLQQRAYAKYHSGGLWTNTCCSHPRPGEATDKAAARRLSEELGFSTDLEKAFDFIYKANFANGLTEYEFDHVYIGHYNGVLQPNLEEVVNWVFMSLNAIEQDLVNHPEKYTVWFQIAFPKLQNWLSQEKMNP